MAVVPTKFLRYLTARHYRLLIFLVFNFSLMINGEEYLRAMIKKQRAITLPVAQKGAKEIFPVYEFCIAPKAISESYFLILSEKDMNLYRITISDFVNWSKNKKSKGIQ